MTRLDPGVHRHPAYLHGGQHRPHVIWPKPTRKSLHDPRPQIRSIDGGHPTPVSSRSVRPDGGLSLRLARKLGEQPLSWRVLVDLGQHPIQVRRALLILPAFELVHVSVVRALAVSG